MSQIDEMIQEFMRRGVLKESTIDNLKRFAREVCKAMLEDIMPELRRIDGKMNDPDGYYKFQKYFKERAERWTK